MSKEIVWAEFLEIVPSLSPAQIVTSHAINFLMQVIIGIFWYSIIMRTKMFGNDGN
jgi:hypothetical protein